MTPREELEGPARTIKTSNLEEAILIAQQHRDRGDYDWFRGQVDTEWAPHSSLLRCFLKLDRSEYHQSRRAVDFLIDWARGVSQLAPTLEGHQPYGVLAIAQHYGIPTNLIDFTTSPRIAGYFAADSREPPEKGMSCIFCLNTKSLENVWSRIRAARHEQALIETVRIDVENLWRLKVQCGVFLFANYEWEDDYPMDRILFPYPGPLSEEQRSEIYPKVRSPLEELLDQHFSRVPMLFAFEAVAEYIKKYSPESTVTRIPTCLSDSNPSVFRGGTRPAPLPSWDPEVLSDWREAYVVEEYHETVGRQHVIDLGDSGHLGVTALVADILVAEPVLRTKDLAWKVHGLADSSARETLENALRLMWNSMRRLPYTNEEISKSARSVAALVAGGFHARASLDQKAKVFADCFGDAFLLGLATEDGGTTSTKLYMPSKMMACELVASPLATPTTPSRTVRAIENLSVACSLVDCLDCTPRSVVSSGRRYL